MLGMEPKAFHMLGTELYHWATSPVSYLNFRNLLAQEFLRGVSEYFCIREVDRFVLSLSPWLKVKFLRPIKFSNW
jgi:hypothetical protein